MCIAEQRYATECVLVDDFCTALKTQETPWGQLHVAREFDYGRGRVDVIAVDQRGTVIAIEAKLTRWRDALHQAYRNTCFAHQSFVLLPEPISNKATCHAADFAKRSVGLCHLRNGSLIVSLPAVHQNPIQPWLSEVAISTATEHSCTRAINKT